MMDILTILVSLFMVLALFALIRQLVEDIRFKTNTKFREQKFKEWLKSIDDWKIK